MNTQNDMNEAREKAKKAFLEHYGLVRFIAFETAPAADVLGDIVNDTFVYFVEKADRWDFNRDLRPLLREVTKNIAMRHWRDHVRNLPENLQKIADILQQSTQNTDATTGTDNLDEELEAMRLCLAKLKPEQRQLVEACYSKKVKLTELARETNMKVGTLRKMMYRIRAAIRDCVERLLKERKIHAD